MSVNIPLTGAGGTTATVAADAVGGEQFQYVKIADGVAGSSVIVEAIATTPNSADGALVVRPIGSTAFTQASVLVAGSSANNIGQVTQGPGSSANPWFFNSIPYSSGSFARTTVNTSQDASIIAANSNRKGLIIASLSTVQVVGIGLSTAATSTAQANVSIHLQPMQSLVFGGGVPGTLPLYTGAVRGCNISSTAVAGGVAVNEIT